MSCQYGVITVSDQELLTAYTCHYNKLTTLFASVAIFFLDSYQTGPPILKPAFILTCFKAGEVPLEVGIGSTGINWVDWLQEWAESQI